MIRLINVSKSYPTTHGRASILRNINLEVAPGEKVGIVGRNGAGKSTMIRLLGEVEYPDEGRLERSMTVSWPLAFGGAFQGGLTGLDNVRFVCRIYGEDWRDHKDYIDNFAELGRFLKEPVATYSSGMRARLAFALSMTIEFDCFLIDEIVAVGDDRFHEKCHIELFEKRADRAMIIVSHDAGYLQSYCQRISVLNNRTMINFDDCKSAYDFYHSTMAL